MIALETKNLIKKFDGVRAVDGVSLKFEKGKITSIVGPNGSGKTTLVNTLSGLLPIDSGLVVIGENKLTKIEPPLVPSLGITRTFQEARLFEQMPVLDNILVVLTERNVFASLFEKHGAAHLKKAEEVLRQVGLHKKSSALANQLSYGQRKLLEIARAIALNSSKGYDINIYLFDEPFAGLFKEMAKVVVALLKELKAGGKTIILIEHNIDLIRELSDYVYVLDSGQLLAGGDPNEVLAKKEVIEAYLGK